MSFKDRVLSHCQDNKHSCYECVLRKSCDKVSDHRMPMAFSEGEFSLLEKYLEDYIEKLEREHNKAETILRGVESIAVDVKKVLEGEST